ncbi:MAG: hypothetical protein V5A34_04505 [Halapricum sp.]
MEATEQSVTTEHESIATPIKVVLAGAILALLEGVYDILNADLHRKDRPSASGLDPEGKGRKPR